MNSRTLEERISDEVRTFLSLFDAWISGRRAVDLDALLVSRLALDGTYVSRNGSVQTLLELADEVRAAHAANPDYAVLPGTVRIIDAHAGRFVILYEERTSGSRLGPAPEFVRMVTAVLREDAGTPGGFRWTHIHEAQRDP